MFPALEGKANECSESNLDRNDFSPPPTSKKGELESQGNETEQHSS